MNFIRQKAIYYITSLASLIIAAQIIIILLNGEAACLNEGCQTIEALTTIPPIYFNLIGLAYFQAVFWSFFLFRKNKDFSIDWPKILLLTGLAVEGVLLAYQIFVARTFCSYCLIIFTIVLSLNILAGRRQIITGAAIIVGINFFFSLLSFNPSLLLATQKMDLNAGTYGTRVCSNSAKQLYLFFSAKCPHCKNVIEALESCNSCQFHFNPIENIQSFTLDGIKINGSYAPEVNSLLLGLLQIDTIPVLIEKNRQVFPLSQARKKSSAISNRPAIRKSLSRISISRA